MLQPIKGTVWEKRFEASKPYVQHFMQNNILKQAKVAERDH